MLLGACFGTYALVDLLDCLCLGLPLTTDDDGHLVVVEARLLIC